MFLLKIFEKKPAGKIIPLFLIAAILVFLILPIMALRPAIAATGDPPMPAGLAAADIAVTALKASPLPAATNAANAQKEVLELTYSQMIGPMIKAALVSMIVNVAQYALDTLAYQSAVWVASGGEGQSSLFNGTPAEEAWKNFGNDVLGEAIGSLNEGLKDYLDVNFNLCAPGNPALRLGLQIGLTSLYQPPEPECNWQAISDNWAGFVQTVQETADDPTAAVLGSLAKGLRPGQNTLSYFVETNIQVQNKYLEAKGPLFSQWLANSGFSGVVDLVTGVQKTPASLVKEQLTSDLDKAKHGKQEFSFLAAMTNSDLLVSLGTHTASVFLNTLLSKLVQDVYNGLFSGTEMESDIFAEESATASGREAAEEKYAGFVSTTPTRLDTYNVLTEFVACPGSSVTRQINNCVADATLMQAVSRSLSANPLTVAEAIDQGYLRGDWALYPPSDLAHNQDIYCYTYGYCYGNLVKLRKARILSIGWEMAAASENNSAEAPITLQEVVDGFNNCNSDRKIDAEHPWCHLIDPNWVLKYPSQRCDASMIGELTFSSAASISRSATCVDAPSCVAEGDDGSCEGYGYCVREKNTWNFNGDECPAEYTSCMSFTNAETAENDSWLFNTLDQSVCAADNAGCQWYRTNKYPDQQETADDDSDDTYEWLPGDEVYLSLDRADDTMTYTDGVVSARADYTYSSDGASEDGAYDLYAFEDRIYFNAEVGECSESAVGCSHVYPIDEEVVLNLLRNPSFEDDDDDDGVADFWTVTAASSGFDYDEEASNSSDGSDTYFIDSGDSLVQTNVPLQQGTFYTISLYTKGGGASLSMDFYASDNSAVDLTGYSTDCATDDTDTLGKTLSASDDYQSYDCTFTTPILDDERLYIVADLTIDSATTAYVDAVQLEAGATPSDFRDGYGSSNLIDEYLQIPPIWLGCEGEESDPDDCDDYAPVCAATEAGCSLYTPIDGDPAVPAVISDEDQCPAECAGYATYRQEDTDYDTGEFPLYFIADTATACSSDNVGCDEFTNLETEGTETYSYLRACVTPEMDEGAVYFTWEGSDLAGYQLVSYQLLESDLSDTGTLVFDESGESESNLGHAPCSNWEVVAADTLVCADSETTIAAQTTCDEHTDILSEPDCREFYDTEGYIHYRLYSETVSVSDDCTAYRKTDANETDCTDSGGYWTTAGECRYFVEPSESTDCPAAAAGCREYTGGSSRNASVIFEDYFEEGSYDNWEAHLGSPSLTISNESVAVDGHSLRVVAGRASDSFRTQYDATTGEGVLVDSLVAGKTYVVSFWAKGTGELEVAMVDNGGSDDAHYFGEAVTLTSGWQPYELGPLDTSGSDYPDFDETAVLVFFVSDAGQTFYLDNIQLEQTEEDLTLVKDSWVTPSTCDETADGAESDQYYLGCEEYTDQNDATYYIYQFSNLCSESAVGCSAFYATQNSESPYSEVYNLTCSAAAAVTEATACSMGSEEVCTISVGQSACQFDYDGNLPTPLPNNISLGPEVVYVQADEVRYLIDDGEHSCTEENIGCAEFGQPTFTQDHTAVESFESVYLLNQPDTYDDTLCADDELFCAEWASTEDGNFYFKDPGDQNCEYKTSVSINGTSYSGWFREGTSEFCYGSGYCSDNTSTACDNDADCLAAGVGECVINSGSYIVDGDYSGIWRNGDDDYGGWAGQCGEQYDLCSEFSDPLDTREGEDLDGASYYYLDNDRIGDEGTISSKRCNEQVSLEEGCVLFDDATDSSADYAVSPSYLLSEHADIFFGDTPRSLEDPVSCDNFEDGEFILTDSSAFNVCVNRCAYEVDEDNLIDNLAVDEGPTADGETTFYGAACYTADDCQVGADAYGAEVEATCQTVDSDYYFINDANRVVKVYRNRECAEWLACSSSYTAWDERTNTWTEVCEDTSLCDEYDTSSSEGGECSDVINEDPIVLDSDRYSSRDVSWYGLEYSGYAIPDQLPVEFYSQVNIASAGYCTNGDGEITIDPTSDGAIIWPCEVAADCTSALAGYCTPTENLRDSDQVSYGLSSSDKYYLAYTASSCDEEDEEACTAGFCTDTGNACSADEECLPGLCIVGYCEEASETLCTSDDDCADTTYSECQSGLCTDTTTSSDDTQETCVSDSDCTAGSCLPGALAKTGTCYGGACLVGLDGQPFDPDSGEDKSCRGYPEANSPYPRQVVTDWIDPSDLQDGVGDSEIVDAESIDFDSAAESIDFDSADIIPYTYVSGFNDATTCSPTPLEVRVCSSSGEVCTSDDDCVEGDEDECETDSYQLTDDCVCSYDKAEYGDGAAVRYYPNQTSEGDMLAGVCLGGVTPGAFCSSDEMCNPNDTDGDGIVDGGGVCQFLTRRESMYGWDGYCVERDSSIQLFGSFAEADRACLTWLPVDQLLGSRDAYANDTEAGYPLEDTYYCGEVGLYVDRNVSNRAELDGVTDPTTASITCAEQDSGATSCDEDGQHDCTSNVWCPYDYFAIMGSCEWDDVGAAAYATACEETGYNDCPFICVPKNSLHEDGSECSPPANSHITYVINDYDVEIYYNSDSDRDGSDFSDQVDEYLDCVNAGVEVDHLSFHGDAPVYSPGSGPTYHDLEIEGDPYLACKDIVQVSTTEGNKAWTNRLWLSGTYAIEDDSYPDFFTNYLVDLEPTRFGQAMSTDETYTLFGIGNLSNLDARPLPIKQCYNNVGNLVIDSSLCQDDIEIGPNDARINLSFSTSEDIPYAYNYLFGEYDYGVGSISSEDPVEDSVVARLSQLFAVSYGLAGSFDDQQEDLVSEFADDANEIGGGEYGDPDDDVYSWDVTVDGDDHGTGPNRGDPEPPTIASIGLCYGSQCLEGEEGKFTLNGFDSTSLTGSGGSYHASVKFYAWANSNQMPIRDVTVDWGDGRPYSDYPWPPNSQSGTRGVDQSYYKNRRGLENQNTENCDKNDEFGLSPDGCMSAYFNYEHDYYCSRSLAGDGGDYSGTLQDCEYANDGTERLITSPCTGGEVSGATNKCVFQPRVHVKDNWGWCTGYCDYNDEEDTESCYGGNECAAQSCPSEGEGASCQDYDSTINPWINYDGVVVVDWQE